jgi:REP element-mobilizing transposase RayT
MEHLKSVHEKFYRLAAAVVMPDHVHLLLCPLPPYGLSRVMKGIKGASARKINQHRRTSGTVWQDESWDRIVRDEEEFSEKLQYMADNPVKTGLVSTLEGYDSWYFNPDFLSTSTDRNVCATNPTPPNEAQTEMSVPPHNDM